MELAVLIISILLGCLLAILVSVTIGVITECWSSFGNKEDIMISIGKVIVIIVTWYFAIDITFDLIKLISLMC